MNTLTMKAKLSRKHIAKGKQVVHLLVEIVAQEEQGERKRLPLNLGFVLDRSGSMSGEKLEFTKQAVRYAIDHLTPDDKASVTVYDQDVQVLFEAGPLKYKDILKSIIGQVYPGGSTNLSGGLIQGFRQVMQHRKSGQVDRVLLLTDGLANVGITDPVVLSAKAASIREAGVAVTTLGVGTDFDEDLLTAIAESSGGNYYYIDSPERIPEIFSSELKELLSVVAQNIQVSFEGTDAVNVSKVWGYRPGGDHKVTINLPDIFASDRKALLLELEVDAGAVGTTSLGVISLSYDDAGDKMERVICSLDLEVIRTDNEELLAQPAEPEVLIQLELCKAAEERDKALRLADEGDMDAAAGTIQASIDSIQYCMAMSVREMSPCLAEEIDKLSKSKAMLQRGRYDKKTRKEIAFESYQSRNARRK